MKKTKFWSILVLVLMGLIPLTITSCSDDEDEHFITVNGTNNAEHTFPGIFANGKSGIDYKQIFKIKSDVQWSLNGKVDWLNVSATSGKGDVDLTIYPSSENNYEAERKATLLLSGGDVNVSIDIIQEAGKPVCHVIPVNEVALYNRICWEFQVTPNVNEFQYLLLSKSTFDRMSEVEKLEAISSEEKLKFVDEWIFHYGYDSYGQMIQENSTYYIAAIGYDGEGKAGEIKYTEIKTPKYLDSVNDAYVSFENIQANSYGFSFDVYKEGYCNTYHLIYGALYETSNSSIYAFQINYYLKHKKKHWFAEDYDLEIVADYPNNHTFSYNSYLSMYPICAAYGWGVFKNGELSSDLLGFQWDTSEEMEEEYIMRRINDNEEPSKNVIIKRSEEKAKVERLRN